jgi:UDP-glucose 4-epimerase
MKILVTGSAGHLGEAIMRTLVRSKHEAIGTDIKASDYTQLTGSIADRTHVKKCMAGVNAVIHTATLHKPHVATHSKQDFIDTNITGTLNLLEEAVAEGVGSFVFTSTTSTFGNALVPEPSAPAAWITEEVVPIPKNIYGVTKTAAEDLCELFFKKHQLPCLILRTSRFFPEEDDSKEMRENYVDLNAKVNEFLARRVDVEDVVTAHLLAIKKAPEIGFERYIISATTPFTPEDLSGLRNDAASVLKKRIPEYEPVFTKLGWKMFPILDRVYVNEKARRELGWQPIYDFKKMLEQLEAGERPMSPLSRLIGKKGYHEMEFEEGPFPVEG